MAKNRRDTGIVGPVAASYAGMPISNVDMVGEDRQESCPKCGGRGEYYAELPNSGDTAGTYVKCDCQQQT